MKGGEHKMTFKKGDLIEFAGDPVEDISDLKNIGCANLYGRIERYGADQYVLRLGQSFDEANQDLASYWEFSDLDGEDHLRNDCAIRLRYFRKLPTKVEASMAKTLTPMQKAGLSEEFQVLVENGRLSDSMQLPDGGAHFIAYLLAENVKGYSAAVKAEELEAEAKTQEGIAKAVTDIVGKAKKA